MGLLAGNLRLPIATGARTASQVSPASGVQPDDSTDQGPCLAARCHRAAGRRHLRCQSPPRPPLVL